jgi:hypothetical protein
MLAIPHPSTTQGYQPQSKPELIRLLTREPQVTSVELVQMLERNELTRETHDRVHEALTLQVAHQLDLYSRTTKV